MVYNRPESWLNKSPYDPVFGNNTWEKIIDACRNNAVPETWAADGTCYKDMLINGANYRIDIIGKNHDTYASGGTAPLTFQMHDCYGSTYRMNDMMMNAGGWEISAMRTKYLPSILNLMPAEVKAGIREVQKDTGRGEGAAFTVSTDDKLFLLSEIEISGSYMYSVSGEGLQYAYYKAGNTRSKKINGSAGWWWTRSPYSYDYYSFCNIQDYGGSSYDYANSSYGVAFGFCF